MRLHASGLRFPEGPVACADGTVLVVEIETGDLASVAPDGEVTRIARIGGGPNGAAVGPDGHVYVCNNGGFRWMQQDGITMPIGQARDYTHGRIERVDLSSGDVIELYAQCGPHRLRAPNDIVFDAHGGFYFTDHGHSRSAEVDKGAVYYARADGSRITCVAFPLMGPNGIGLSPDGDVLYVTETPTSRLWSWQVEAPGKLRSTGSSPAPGTLVYSFDGYQLLDSLAIDADGNICIGTLMSGTISVVSPEGVLLEQHAVPEPDLFVTNICFGGVGGRTAYITSSGRGLLYAMEWARGGAPLSYHK